MDDVRSARGKSEAPITTFGLTTNEFVDVTRHTDPKRARECAPCLLAERRVENDVIDDQVDAAAVHGGPRLVSEFHDLVELVSVLRNPGWRWTAARHDAHLRVSRGRAVVAGHGDVRVGPSPNEYVKARRK